MQGEQEGTQQASYLVIQGGPAMCGLLDESTFYSWKTKTGFPLIPRALTLVLVTPVGFGAHTHTHGFIRNMDYL